MAPPYENSPAVKQNVTIPASSIIGTTPPSLHNVGCGNYSNTWVQSHFDLFLSNMRKPGQIKTKPHLETTRGTSPKRDGCGQAAVFEKCCRFSGFHVPSPVLVYRPKGLAGEERWTRRPLRAHSGDYHRVQDFVVIYFLLRIDQEFLTKPRKAGGLCEVRIVRE